MGEKEITVKQAAEIAGVAKETIYYWIQLSKLEGIARKHFGRIKINKAKFEQWVKDNTQ
ncbi:MAG: helix-turn-helix domain-containing protein [Bacteroidota bacterium]